MATSIPGAPARKDAAVVVDHLSPQLLVEGEDRSSWRSIPAYLRGADIHSLGDGHQGVGRVEVSQSGILYMAAHFGYEGNRSGGWTEERITFDELIELGWSFVGKMKHGNGRVFRILRREVKAGEHYGIRVNKYTPPYFITLNEKAGTLLSAEVPWLRFGPVAVADFMPRTLQPGIKGGRGIFQQVPDSLRGMSIFSDEYRGHDGALEFHVIEKTRIYLAGFWGYDGNTQGDWDEERLTLDDMLGEGWQQVADLTQENGRVYNVVTKVLPAGVTHRFRFNKYTPPHLILPESSYQIASQQTGKDTLGNPEISAADSAKALPRFSATSQQTLAPRPVLWVERARGGFVVQWHPSIPGSYLETCTDLSDPQWIPVEGGGSNPCRLSASASRQFFRIVVPN